LSGRNKLIKVVWNGIQRIESKFRELMTII
jgi:hypothetical protein